VVTTAQAGTGLTKKKEPPEALMSKSEGGGAHERSMNSGDQRGRVKRIIPFGSSVTGRRREKALNRVIQPRMERLGVTESKTKQQPEPARIVILRSERAGRKRCKSVPDLFFGARICFSKGNLSLPNRTRSAPRYGSPCGRSDG